MHVAVEAPDSAQPASCRPCPPRSTCSASDGMRASFNRGGKSGSSCLSALTTSSSSRVGGPRLLSSFCCVRTAGPVWRPGARDKMLAVGTAPTDTLCRSLTRCSCSSSYHRDSGEKLYRVRGVSAPCFPCNLASWSAVTCISMRRFSCGASSSAQRPCPPFEHGEKSEISELAFRKARRMT